MKALSIYFKAIILSLLMILPVYAADNTLLSYFKDTINAAGFSETAQQYLIDISSKQLTNHDEKNYANDLRTLKMNLSKFFKTLSLKNTADNGVIERQYSLSNKYPEPWDFILSKENLAIFKENHIFENITVDDIKIAYSKYCPFWPFCEK